jgi:hypothetical protein
MQPVTDVSKRHEAGFCVFEPCVFCEDRAFPIELFNQIEWKAAKLNISGAFRGVEFDLY